MFSHLHKMRYALVVLLALAYVTYVHSDACVQCNSATDPKCATEPSSFMAKQCVNASSICFTRVLDGNTIRGCASELNNVTAARCNNEMECLICSFMEGCNRQIFPTHRAQCLQCEGNSTSLCATDVFAKPMICPIYKLGDKCFIRNTGKNTTTSFSRGCLSSAVAKKVCVNNRNCYTCEGAGCNFLPYNSTEIPTARDSATLFGYSLPLLVVGFFFATRATLF